MRLALNAGGTEGGEIGGRLIAIGHTPLIQPFEGQLMKHERRLPEDSTAGTEGNEPPATNVPGGLTPQVDVN